MTSKSKSELAEINRHHEIKITWQDNLRLFLANSLGGLFCDCCWGKKRKMQRLYEEGQDRIETELDLVKLMKNLRNMKVLMRNSLMNKQVKFDILHSYKNLINLDSDLGSDHSDPLTEIAEKEEEGGTIDPRKISANLRQKSRAKLLKWTQKFQSAIKNLKHSRRKLDKQSAAFIITRWSREVLFRKYQASNISNPNVSKIIEDLVASGYFDRLQFCNMSDTCDLQLTHRDLEPRHVNVKSPKLMMSPGASMRKKGKNRSTSVDLVSPTKFVDLS